MANHGLKISHYGLQDDNFFLFVRKPTELDNCDLMVVCSAFYALHLKPFRSVERAQSVEDRTIRYCALHRNHLGAIIVVSPAFRDFSRVAVLDCILFCVIKK